MDDGCSLTSIHGLLQACYGPVQPLPPRGPFEWILWEQVAYLASDSKRSRAFEKLRDEVGLSPDQILRAPLERLRVIAASGGAIAPELRAERMQESARRVLSEWNGDLSAVLGLEEKKAVGMLSKFPMIGKPGAEKILLMTRSRPVLALDSNGLRVLLRLGYGEPDSNYDKSYRSVRAATVSELPADCDWLISFHSLLRKHGRTLCLGNRPQCDKCPLRESCAYFQARRSGPIQFPR